MKKWKKPIIYGLLLLGSIILIYALISGNRVTANVAEVKKSNIAVMVTEKGVLNNREQKDIVSEVNGKIAEIFVETGTKVIKGQLLASIVTEELDQQLAKFQGQLKAIQGTEKATAATPAELRKAQLELEKTKIALNIAKENYQRLIGLYEEGAITKVELEQGETDLRTKEKIYLQVQSDLLAAQLRSSGNNLQFSGQKESILAEITYLEKQKQKSRIYAPREGVILDKKINKGDLVTIGAPLFAFGSESYDVEAYLNSKDIGNCKLGDNVQVKLAQGSQTIAVEGKISKIAAKAEERTSVLGVVEPRVKLTISLAHKPENITIISGMEVDVDFVTEKAANVLTVPKTAIFTMDDKEFLWLIVKGKAKKTEVKTGLEDDSKIEIKAGLREGDKIITDPNNSKLKEGVTIKET